MCVRPGWHCSQSSLELLSGDRNAALSELRPAFDTMESARLLVGVDGAFESIADDAEFITVLGRLGRDRWCGVRVVHDGLLTRAPLQWRMSFQIHARRRQARQLGTGREALVRKQVAHGAGADDRSRFSQH